MSNDMKKFDSAPDAVNRTVSGKYSDGYFLEHRTYALSISMKEFNRKNFEKTFCEDSIKDTEGRLMPVIGKLKSSNT